MVSIRATSALDRVRQVRHVQRLALIFAGSGCVVGWLYSSVLQARKERAQPAVQHALALCRQFAVQCEPDGEVQFCRDNLLFPASKFMTRPLWAVPIRADGQHYALLMRADTKRLCLLFNLSPLETQSELQKPGASAFSASRAVNQSLLYLRRLKLVAPETQIALDAAPEQVRDGTSWRVVWKTRALHSATEEALRIVISRKSGRLLQLADTSALNQPVE